MPIPQCPPASLIPAEPPPDCPLCPRLAAFRDEQRGTHPAWFNAPVPAFGDPDAWLAIVGLAPGLQGANRTGRPFTGDFAGILLYRTLLRFGLAHGRYDAQPHDGMVLVGTAIVNSVRCVPPQNKPLPQEIRTCARFLEPAIALLPRLRVVVALGQIAHGAAARLLGLRASQARFGHLAEHRAPGGLTLIDSYHCSRYNQNTGVLTPAMFEAVFARALELAPADPAQLA